MPFLFRGFYTCFRVHTLSPDLIETPIIDEQFSTKEEADGARAMFEQITPLGQIGRADEMAAAAALRSYKPYEVA